MKQYVFKRIILFGFAVFGLLQNVQAQDPTLVSASLSTETDYDKGLIAFREGEYEKAERLFLQVDKKKAQYAPSQYMLARIYTETNLGNLKKANRAIEQALAIEPENVEYLVASLELLRSPSSNFIQERLKDSQRRDLARKILKLDEKNAFAHEEIGISYINDYWRFRNALAIPALDTNTRTRQVSDTRDRPTQAREDAQQDNTDLPDTNIDPTNPLASATSIVDSEDPFGALAFEKDVSKMMGINSVFNDDQFDLKALQEQGVPIQDLSGRADYAYDKALSHLRQALVSDPRRRSVYDQLMKVYTLKEDFSAALEMLRTMYSFFDDEVNTWLYMGLAYQQLGDLQNAAESFESAFNFMDEEMRTAFEDIGLLIRADEQEAYKSDPYSFKTKFWNSQNPRFLTGYNERRLEHYGRLVNADLLFGAPKLNRRGWETQRGQIWLRYGKPQIDVVVEKSDALGTGAVLEDIDQVDDDRSNFSTDSFFNPGKQAVLYNIWDYGVFRFVFEDPFRNGEYQFFSPSAEDIAFGVNAALNDYKIIAENTFRRVPERYVYKTAGRLVELPYLVNMFKGDNGRADIYVHAGIPITEYESNKDFIDINLNVGTFLISEDRDILFEKRQTLYGLKTNQISEFEDANLWVYTQEMHTTPGKQQVSVEFETASQQTVGVQRRDIEVPDFDNGKLAVSDAMLAYAIEESFDNKAVVSGDIVRNGLSITPAPWSVFGHGQPIYLYFEVYNLNQNGDGTTEFEVEAVVKPKDTSTGARNVLRRIFRRGDKGVGERFTATGASQDDGQYLILDVSNEDPGLYTLTLRIKDVLTGKEVETHKDLFIE